MDLVFVEIFSAKCETSMRAQINLYKGLYCLINEQRSKTELKLLKSVVLKGNALRYRGSISSCNE